jgi:hypothetical protein
MKDMKDKIEKIERNYNDITVTVKEIFERKN